MMKQKKTIGIFLIILAGMVFLAATGIWGHAQYLEKQNKLSQKDLDNLSITREKMIIPGLKKEYHLFFMADSHISLCDERDGEVQEKAEQRQAGFVDENGTPSYETFDRLIKASNTLGSDLLILGGDIIDSAMYASVDYVTEELNKLDAPYVYCLGNHDFEYGNEYFSEKAYEEYRPRLKEITAEDTWQMVEYEDLIIFTADDRNNQIEKSTVKGLMTAIKKEKPIVLVMHVPMEPLTGDTSLLEDSIQVWGPSEEGNSRVIIGEDGCQPKKYTQKFIDLVTAKDSPVKLVLGGHIHFYHKDNITEDLVQIVTGAAYEKHALYVTLTS